MPFGYIENNRWYCYIFYSVTLSLFYFNFYNFYWSALCYVQHLFQCSHYFNLLFCMLLIIELSLEIFCLFLMHNFCLFCFYFWRGAGGGGLKWWHFICFLLISAEEDLGDTSDLNAEERNQLFARGLTCEKQGRREAALKCYMGCLSGLSHHTRFVLLPQCLRNVSTG